jgi:hypothetical protein
VDGAQKIWTRCVTIASPPTLRPPYPTVGQRRQDHVLELPFHFLAKSSREMDLGVVPTDVSPRGLEKNMAGPTGASLSSGGTVATGLEKDMVRPTRLCATHLSANRSRPYVAREKAPMPCGLVAQAPWCDPTQILALWRSNGGRRDRLQLPVSH